MLISFYLTCAARQSCNSGIRPADLVNVMVQRHGLDEQKNLPDAASAYSYLPTLPFSPHSTSNEKAPFSSIPTTNALPARSGFFSPPHISRVQPSPTPQSTLSPRPTPPRQASMDSNISIKSLRDAEREVAELRLAMMGMGKAMTAWMEAIAASATTSSKGDLSGSGKASAAPTEGGVKEFSTDTSDWKGLERVRDTLLDAAGSEIDDIARQWAWHDGLEAPPSNHTSRGGTPSMSRSDSGSFVNLSGEAIQIKNLDLTASGQTISTSQNGGIGYSGSQGREEEVTPRQADTARMAQASLPGPRGAQRPASVGVPNVTITSPATATRAPARPTTLPPPARIERISPTKMQQQPTATTGSASSSMPRQLLLRSSLSGSAPAQTKPVAAPLKANRPSLSERLSAASRPTSAAGSRQPSASAAAAGMSLQEESSKADPGDPLAGMGVGVSVPKSARKWDTGVHDPLGAGH